MEKLKPKVYISYSWAEPSKGIVWNWLSKSLSRAGINCVYDRKDNGFNKNIIDFEKEISRGSQVIFVIGRKYLESIDCMYEAACFFEKGDSEKRGKFVNLNDFNLTNEFYSDLLKYWASKVESLKKLVEDGDSPANLPYVKDWDRAKKIYSQLGTLWTHIREHNSLTFTELSKNDYLELINVISNVEVYPIDLDSVVPVTDIP